MRAPIARHGTIAHRSRSEWSGPATVWEDRARGASRTAFGMKIDAFAHILPPRYFEILCALYALARRRPDNLRELVPSWRDGAVPGAFWIRRV